jgi:hypothetical protein
MMKSAVARRAANTAVLPVIVLLSLNALFFFRAFFTGDCFYFRDIYSFHLPLKEALLLVVKEGSLPLWDPYVSCGQPMLANPNYCVLSPFNFFYLFLPAVAAFKFAVLAAFFMAGVSVFFLGRDWGMSRASSLLAGVAFEFCGFTQSLGNLSTALTAFAFLPPVVLFYGRALRRNPGRNAVIASLLLALQFFCGEPVISLLTVFLVFLLTAGRAWREGRKPLQRLRIFFGVAILSFCISAVQFIPAAELLTHSSRGQGYAMERSQSWSLSPISFAEFLLPTVFGNLAEDTPDSFWAAHLFDKQIPYLLSIYPGIAVLFLSIVAVFLSRDRAVPILSIAAALSLLLAMGRHIPHFSVAYEIVPIFRYIRYPVKFLGIFAFSGSLLAGLGLEALRNEDFRGWKKWRRGAPLVIGLIGMVLILLPVILEKKAESEGRDFLRGVIVQPGISESGWTRARARIMESAATSTIVAAACMALFLMRSGRRLSGSWLAILFLAVVGADLLPPAARLNPVAPPDLIQVKPLGTDVVRRAGAGARFYSHVNFTALMQDAEKGKGTAPWIWVPQRAGLLFSGIPWGLQYGFSEDVDGMMVRESFRLATEVDRGGWRAGRMLDLAAVKFLLTNYAPPPGDFRLVKDYASTEPFPLRLYENGGAAPRAFLARRSLREAASEDEAVRLLLSPDVEPLVEPVVVPGERDFSGSGGLCPGGVDAGRCELLTGTANRVEIETAAETATVLVLCDTFFPGWRAYIDGKRGEILRVNLAFRGLCLPPGKHRVKFLYRPASFFAGLGITIAGLCVGAILGTRRRSSVPDGRQDAVGYPCAKGTGKGA